MTTRRHFINNASVVELVSAITSGATTCQVTDATSFPVSYPWPATIDAGAATAECVLVTAASGTTLTITRGYDGTAAQAHAANASFAHTATQADYDEANLHTTSTGGVHGVVGDLVGTTDTQTLSNKTLTAPTVSGGTFTNSALQTPTITNPSFTGFPPAGLIAPYAGLTVPSGWLLCDGRAVSRTTYADLWAALHISLTGATIASDGSGGYTATVSSTTGLYSGMAVTAGAGTGVIGSVNSSTQFGIFGSGFSTSGTQTITVAPYGAGNGTSTFNLPNFSGKFIQGAAQHTNGADDGLGVAGGESSHSHTLSGNGQALVYLDGPDGVVLKQAGTGNWTPDFQSGSGRTTFSATKSFGAALNGSTDTATAVLPPYQNAYYIIKS